MNDMELELFRAIHNDEIAKIKNLICVKKVSPNCKAEDGWRPIHVAAFKGNTRIIKILLRNGANVHILTECVDDADIPQTAMDIALSRGHKEAFTFLTLFNKSKNGDSILTQHLEVGMIGEKQDYCSICMEMEPLYEIITCKHMYCMNCLCEWIKQTLADGFILPKCPDRNCQSLLGFSEVALICTNAGDSMLVQQTEQRLTNRMLESCPEFIQCPSCLAGGLYSYKNGSELDIDQWYSKLADLDISYDGSLEALEFCVVNCASCEHSFCSLCRRGEHGGQTCSEYLKLLQRNKKNDVKGEIWVKKNSKACPSCGYQIQHNGGCSHMSCSRCKYQFCWICLGEYKNMHTFALNGPCPCPK